MTTKEWIEKVKELSVRDYCYDMTEAYDDEELEEFSGMSPKDFIMWQVAKFGFQTEKEFLGE